MSALAIIVLAVVLGPSLLLFGAAALIYAHETRRPGLTEAQAQANCRPHLDPITPAYYGLPPHNGKVADPAKDEP